MRVAGSPAGRCCSADRLASHCIDICTFVGPFGLEPRRRYCARGRGTDCGRILVQLRRLANDAAQVCSRAAIACRLGGALFQAMLRDALAPVHARGFPAGASSLGRGHSSRSGSAGSRSPGVPAIWVAVAGRRRRWSCWPLVAGAAAQPAAAMEASFSVLLARRRGQQRLFCAVHRIAIPYSVTTLRSGASKTVLDFAVVDLAASTRWTTVRCSAPSCSNRRRSAAALVVRQAKAWNLLAVDPIVGGQHARASDRVTRLTSAWLRRPALGA